jgi:hypothetical protein
MVEVAKPAHGGSNENFAGDGEGRDPEDGGPGVK